VTRPLRRLPLAEQTAAHLREGFQSGRWAGQLPGVHQLAGELAVSNHTVRTALKMLEQEGWLEDCGSGRRRRIVANQLREQSRRSLRIGVMLYDPFEGADARSIKILLGIRIAIEAAGHVCIFSDQCLIHLNDDLSKIARLVKKVDADAWIVCAASRSVLEWFIAQPFPVYASGGRFQDLPVACHGVRIAPAIESAVNRLVALGHRRIVMLIQTLVRQPRPIPSVEFYLSLLEAHGIPTSEYNLPHFDETPASLEHRLDTLFRITPPTAVLAYDPCFTAAVLSFLSGRGLRVPRDVSVISMTMDPIFRLNVPPVDHFSMPSQELVARISRWVNGVAKGRPDRRQVIFDAMYVPGGTVGPVKK
jgi:DNA-binding LacI/PurR family transcriptional regulator